MIFDIMIKFNCGDCWAEIKQGQVICSKCRSELERDSLKEPHDVWEIIKYIIFTTLLALIIAFFDFIVMGIVNMSVDIFPMQDWGPILMGWMYLFVLIILLGQIIWGVLELIVKVFTIIKDNFEYMYL